MVVHTLTTYYKNEQEKEAVVVRREANHCDYPDCDVIQSAVHSFIRCASILGCVFVCVCVTLVSVVWSYNHIYYSGFSGVKSCVMV